MTKAIDRATAFYNEVSGQGTYKIVCKASNHDLAGPKKKHVDALLQITNNPRTQMSMLVDLISERLKDKNWVVVFKTLIVGHNLMTLGHEKFMQCIATRSNTFNMEAFNDRTDYVAVDMSTHLRKYATYLTCICNNYKSMATDVTRIAKGELSPFKTMEPAKILKTTQYIQKQLDTLLEIELTSGDLTNGVINTAFLMLYKDLVKLYTVYNDLMINLLEKFFEMKKSLCRETIEFYRRFLTRQEGVQSFLQLAEKVGIDKQTHLNLRQVPEDLLPALENHLTDMDTQKKASGDASPSIRAASEKLAALKSTEKKVEPTVKTSDLSSQILPSASSEVLEAQRKRFEELKRQAGALKSVSNSSSESSTAASKQLSVASKTSNLQSSADDLLGLDISNVSLTSQQDPWKSSPSHSITPAASSIPFQPISTTSLPVGNGSAEPQQNNPWEVSSAPPSAYQEVDLFSEIRGSQEKTSFDAVFSSSAQPTPSQSNSQFPVGGGILQPQAAGPLVSKELLEPTKPITGLDKDVESSLAKAAANLSVDLGGGPSRAGISKKTEHQWTPAKESMKTGGSNFQKQAIQARTLHSNNQPSTTSTGGTGVDWNKGMYGGYFPHQYPTQQPMSGPPMMVGPPMMGYGMMPPQQLYGMGPAPMVQPQWYPNQQQPFPQQQLQSNDPFGAIPSQNKPLF